MYDSMKRLSKETIDRLDGVSLFRLFPGADVKGGKGKTRCPMCGADGRGKSGKAKKAGLSIVDDGNKRLVKCNDCGFGAGGSAINVLRKIDSLGFMEACQKISDMIGIQLNYENDNSDKYENKKQSQPPQTDGVAHSVGKGEKLEASSMVSALDVKKEEEGVRLEADGKSSEEISSLVGDGEEQTELTKRKRGRPRAVKMEGADPSEGSFTFRQLKDSGLTPDDVRARVRVGEEWTEVCPFRKGKLDIISGQVTEWGDEMIISYFGLEGERKMCIPAKNRSKEVGYNRVRWQNPEAHSDRKGKGVKYQSIYGSGIELYFPELIRRMYLDSERIDTLYVQEGEKKAEKACKHGLPSIGIQGISNFGSNDKGLPDEVQYLVQRCDIKEICFIMDSDWDDLGKEILPEESVDRRPKSFANALIKFRNQVKTLGLCGLDVDILWGHVNGNEEGEKGIDDLLVGRLKDQESELTEDIRRARLAHDGRGEYVTIRNVTSWSDYKIMGLWGLNSADDFFALHKERLESLKSFQFQGVLYVVDGGKIKVSTEFGEGKLFWSISFDEKNRKKVDIDLIDLRSWLHVNGYRCWRNEEGKRVLVKVSKGIIHSVDEYDVREFVLSFVFKATKDRAVHLVFAESIDSRLSIPKLLQLQLLVTNAGRPTADAQRFYYRNSQLRISGKDIEVSALKGPVWEENLIDRQFQRERIFEAFEPDGRGSFRVRLTDAGRESEFLTYLLRTCDMWDGRMRTAQQDGEFWRHVANRITSIGYLLRDYRDMGEDKAVVAMDATMVEVGVNNGRSGKSLVGKALKQMVSQAFIDGPNLENNDQFIFSDVRKTTRNVFLDDIKQEFDFTKFKSRITGELNVNVKQGGRFVIPYNESPKFYLTSNHALDGLDPSCMARIVFMSFSSWYHDGHSPETEFGHLFFEGWDERQWQLFDNLMAECVMIYIRSAEGRWGAPNKGLISPPMDDLNRRTYRQEMGETFLAWAELYFGPGSGNLDRRIARKTIYEAYLDEYGIKSTQMTSKTFRQKLVAYCRYAGLHLNAHRPSKDGESFADHFARRPGETFVGQRDVTGSLEYYTISSLEGLMRQEGS